MAKKDLPCEDCVDGCLPCFCDPPERGGAGWCPWDKGACPGCSERLCLDRRGRVRDHEKDGKPCPGSGELPKEGAP